MEREAKEQEGEIGREGRDGEGIISQCIQHTCARVRVRVTQENLWASVLSFHSVMGVNQNCIVRVVVDKCLLSAEQSQA